MEKPRIEKSCERGRFTPGELRTAVRESKAFWSSPEGKAAAAKQEREKRNRKLPATKFPGVGTRPKVTGMTAGEARTQHAKNILRRIELNAPKI